MLSCRTPKPYQVVLKSILWLIGLTSCFVKPSVVIADNQKPMESPDFVSDIQPIFQQHCYSCHGSESQESGYRLDVREIALRGGDSGETSIIAASSTSSKLIHFVRAVDDSTAMPPKDSGIDRLSPEQIETIAAWIDAGAIWPNEATAALPDPLDWWSLKPLEQPPIPIKSTSNNSIHAVSSNPIDAFIDAKLQQLGLAMAPEADSRTLCRRLYFDLVGLPPAPETVDTFEVDARNDPIAAYARLVDALLDSPHYGERWARHWLDVVHYGDTHGYDKDQPRTNAWPYRDYVVRALNEDKPYGQFIQEQIAGDVLFPESRDGIEALGFLAAGPWDFIGHAEVSESKIDGKIARHMDRDDVLGNAIGTLCSATIQCAQCHNHKFDPFSQEDYYSLQAVFSALDRADKSYDIDPEIARQRETYESEKRELQDQLHAFSIEIARLVGPELEVLEKEIRVAEASQKVERPPQYGWHSELAITQETLKWVQVDLGAIQSIEKIVLHPTWDDFNSIGAGFGFPVRYRIEISSDESFSKDNFAVVSREETDTLNPGVSTQTFSNLGKTGRYVRITATKLAPRANDYMFALAELEVFDASGKNLALSRSVQSIDSIEAPVRWTRTNLTDGVTPTMILKKDLEDLLAKRHALIESRVEESIRLSQAETTKLMDDVIDQISKLPPPSIVYAGTVHHGSGNFVGTGSQGGKARPISVLARGQVTKPIREVGPGALAVINSLEGRFDVSIDSLEGARREALANWIIDKKNPLTWRSIVNRVWQYHFGRGIVSTSNDFGRMGDLPTHPELLDYLAADFRDNGGSLKALHRLIVTSNAYRQSSDKKDPKAVQLDPMNTMLWRQNRRKLDAESIRDSVLSVGGTLDLTTGGPGWQDFVVTNPAHSPHYEYQLSDPNDTKTWRRSIYRFIVRSQTQPFMTALNCADPSMRIERRNESESPQQALALLNNGFILTQSKHFANRVERDVGGDVALQVDRAYRLTTGNRPTEVQKQKITEFVDEYGLVNLCRVLLNINEFVFVD